MLVPQGADIPLTPKDGHKPCSAGNSAVSGAFCKPELFTAAPAFPRPTANERSLEIWLENLV